MKLILRFIYDLIKDYHSEKCLKKQKRQCYRTICRFFLSQVFSFLTAWAVFPVMYLFRYKIAYRYYDNGPFNYDLNYLVDESGHDDEIKELKKCLGSCYWFLWTYSDEGVNIKEKGIVPDSYKPHIKNRFLRRYLWSAIRNPRAIICHMFHRTKGKWIYPRLSTQNLLIDKQVKVYGFGTMQAITLFVWHQYNDRLYLYYHTVHKNKFLYFGFVPAYYKHELQPYRRFECSLRSCEEI